MDAFIPFVEFEQRPFVAFSSDRLARVAEECK